MKIAFALIAAASVLAEAGPVRAAEPPAAQTAVTAPDTRTREHPEEYGTPATVIRAFYAALGEGQGELASMVVVPEKTATGPFSAAELSRFYGSLSEPISIVDLFPARNGEYIVHYRYAATRRRCDGRAVVRTVTRGKRYYIQGIRALNGC